MTLTRITIMTGVALIVGNSAAAYGPLGIVLVALGALAFAAAHRRHHHRE